MLRSKKRRRRRKKKRETLEREKRGTRNLRSLRFDFWSKRAFFESEKLERRKPLQKKPNLLLGEQRRENSCLFESNQLPIIPRAWTLILYIHQVNRRKRRARESALPAKFEQSKEKNYPPTSLVTLLCIFCVLGRAHSCALCAPSGRRGESRRAGDGNPALLLLCSNRP